MSGVGKELQSSKGPVEKEEGVIARRRTSQKGVSSGRQQSRVWTSGSVTCLVSLLELPWWPRVRGM